MCADTVCQSCALWGQSRDVVLRVQGRPQCLWLSQPCFHVRQACAGGQPCPVQTRGRLSGGYAHAGEAPAPDCVGHSNEPHSTSTLKCYFRYTGLNRTCYHSFHFFLFKVAARKFELTHAHMMILGDAPPWGFLNPAGENLQLEEGVRKRFHSIWCVIDSYVDP